MADPATNKEIHYIEIKDYRCIIERKYNELLLMKNTYNHNHHSHR